MCATVGRLVLAKLWLMAHHPLSATSRSQLNSLTKDIRDRLFATSVEVIEFSHVLEANEQTAKWGWLFRTYMQWHAVAFVLAELVKRPPGPDWDRAWRSVEAVYDERVTAYPRMQKGMLWKPMRLLMEKAKAVREQRMRDQGRGNRISDIQYKSPKPLASERTARQAMDDAQAGCARTIGGQPMIPSQATPHIQGNDVISAAADAFGLDLPFDFDSISETPTMGNNSGNLGDGIDMDLDNDSDGLQNLNMFFPDPMGMPMFTSSAMNGATTNSNPDHDGQDHDHDNVATQYTNFGMESNLTEADINQWLAHEQLAQQNPEFMKWSNISYMNDDVVNSLASPGTGGQQGAFNFNVFPGQQGLAPDGTLPTGLPQFPGRVEKIVPQNTSGIARATAFPGPNMRGGW